MTFIPVKSRPGSNVYIAHLQEKIRSKQKRVESKHMPKLEEKQCASMG